MESSLAVRRKIAWAFGALAATLLIGLLDRQTGFEVRVYPLYFLPLMAVARVFAAGATLLAALIVTVVWTVANAPVGVSYPAHVWLFNAFAQALAFTVVALLISRLRSSLQRERDFARTDPLTGLLNTRAFLDKAETTLALLRRQSAGATLAFIDLDNFKKVNDNYGHERGSDTLCKVADLLRSGTREGDLVARFGGDEFVVLLAGIDPDSARGVLERFRAAVEASLKMPDVGVTASIGAISYGNAPQDVNAMMRNADARLYEVKAAGKNQVRLIAE